jgi:hypothetical protein
MLAAIGSSFYIIRMPGPQAAAADIGYQAPAPLARGLGHARIRLARAGCQARTEPAVSGGCNARCVEAEPTKCPVENFAGKSAMGLVEGLTMASSAAGSAANRRQIHDYLHVY